MADNFPAFAKLVAADFQDIAAHANVFRVDIDADALYAQYLAAFPEGTNPIFRKNTEHDCSLCKQFIRHVGNVIAVDVHNNVWTVWDAAAEKAQHPYNVVAAFLRDLVRATNIADLFRVNTKESAFGAKQSRSMDATTKNLVTWNHLHTGPIPASLQVASPGETCGAYRTTVQVFERGLVELKPEAVEIVQSLIEANNLYRGEENKAAVTQFRKSQIKYNESSVREKHLFVWTHAQGVASRFRNTAIGTLVQDLSEGMDVDRAVKGFEAKVARPSRAPALRGEVMGYASDDSAEVELLLRVLTAQTEKQVIKEVLASLTDEEKVALKARVLARVEFRFNELVEAEIKGLVKNWVGTTAYDAAKKKWGTIVVKIEKMVNKEMDAQVTDEYIAKVVHDFAPAPIQEFMRAQIQKWRQSLGAMR